ncbi:MAG TPA: GDSL-type esterase/lipase family protein [Planctomycetaceae bacterium]|nr:GDSL-type esterase/lipase family protein [Planctomycetaceae bacterium]
MDSQTPHPDATRQPAANAVVPLSARKKLLFGGLTCLAVLGLLELAARLLAPPHSVDVYDEHRRLIEVAGLPALNEALEFDPVRFWKLKDSVRDLHVAGTLGRHAIDFRLTTHDGRRSPPVSGKAAYRVLAIGDSCTFGVGVDDDESWPAMLQRQFERGGRTVEVINAGVPGYTAYQGRRYLESEGLALRPDVVVACFGFNDRDSWASRSDVETARLLASSGHDSPLMQSRLYAAIRRLLRDSGEPDENAAARPRLSVIEFRDTLREIHGLCDQAGAKLVLLVWPFEPQVRQRVRELEPYQQTVVTAGRRMNVPVINLVDAFIDSQRDGLFVDHIHAAPAGCRLAAEAISTALAPPTP